MALRSQAMNRVVNHIHSNIYTSDLLLALRYAGDNHFYSRNLYDLEKVDPLLDFHQFKQSVSDYKKRISSGSLDVLHRVGSESIQYGHARALLAYAGVKNETASGLLLPYVEHGIAYTDELPVTICAPYVHLTISQGDYRKGVFRENRPDIPHYCIGPYISYAQSELSDSELLAAKRKLGKTLLVFPSHTYEMSQLSYAREAFVDEIVRLSAKHFDSILVSAYWHDVDDPVFDEFERVGATVVSSGLRGDSKFISRLKSMLMLSDAVAGNGLGTHIGYAYSMKKPFKFIGSGRVEMLDAGHVQKKEELVAIEELFSRAFSSFNPSRQAEMEQRRLVGKYWGDQDLLMEPEEVRAIIENAREVIKISKGFGKKYPKAFRQIWENLQCDKTPFGQQRRDVLSRGFE